MLMFSSGGVALLAGAIMLMMARIYPERNDVGVLRGVGYVSIGCGLIMLLVPTASVLMWLFV